MKKKLTTYIILILLLTGCSLFQKDNNDINIPTTNTGEIFIEENNSGDLLEIKETNTGNILEENLNNSGTILQENINPKISKADILKIYEENSKETQKGVAQEVVVEEKVKDTINSSTTSNTIQNFEDYSQETFNPKSFISPNTSTGNTIESGSKDLYFVTYLETAGEKLDNKYNISVQFNSGNKFVSNPIEETEKKQLDATFYLELQTSNEFDNVFYYPKTGGEIKATKNNNKYSFIINSLFELPSYYAEGEVRFFKDGNEIRRDKIRATNKKGEYVLQYLDYLHDEDYGDIEHYYNIHQNLEISQYYKEFHGTINHNINNLGNYIVIEAITAGCGGESTSQKILDKNLKETKEFEDFKTLNSIKFGNIEYKYNGTDISIRFSPAYEYSYGYMGTSKHYFEGKSIYDKNAFSTKDFEEMSSITDEIYIKWNELPIIFSYKLANSINTPKKSFRIVQVPEIYRNLIADDGKVMDIDLTDKILNNEELLYESGWANLTGLDMTEREYTDDVIDGVGKEKLVLKESDLPIINLYKLNDNGYYSLSFYDPYDFIQYAEFCKPAIYVYTPTQETQSVTLKPTSKKSHFTKLIPEFDTGTTWNYTTNPTSGDLTCSDNNNYDYLYYSIKVPNYTFNENGWQVKGADIERFFEDKLTKMNFNEKEKADFIEYWLEMYDDKEAYYFVSFKYNEDFDKYVKLEFNKKPETIFRVLLESYKLDKSVLNDMFKYENVGDKFDKYLIKKANRNSNFDVFEWGGVFYHVETNSFTIY